MFSRTEKEEMLKTLIKENKRLKHENEKLRKFLEETKEDRAKYRQLADDIKVLKKKYEEGIDDLTHIQEEYKKKLDDHVALEQQLGHTGCTTEVTVNLEWRVCIPQVVERTVLQEVAEELVCVVTVLQASPLVELPTHTPTGCTIATMFEHDGISILLPFKCHVLFPPMIVCYLYLPIALMAIVKSTVCGVALIGKRLQV